MNRGWKILIALASVGLAGFLVWAFRSPGTTPLAIHYQGCDTSEDPRFTGKWGVPTGSVSALFVVSNQSDRAMTPFASYMVGNPGAEISHGGNWNLPTNHANFGLISHPTLQPKQTAWFAALVPEDQKTVRVSVQALETRSATTRLGRYLNGMPWNTRRYSVWATNELR